MMSFYMQLNHARGSLQQKSVCVFSIWLTDALHTVVLTLG